MRRVATFDSSFWVHTVYLDLLDFLLADFDLICTGAVESELGRENPTSIRLKELLANKRIQRARPRSNKMRLYGDGERAAINLALERKLLLLIDDWRPYEAAQAAGAEVVSSVAYLVGLYGQNRVTIQTVLNALARLARRGTIRPEWIETALKMISETRKKGRDG